MPAAVADELSPPTADAYRRAARRLRCRFAGQPGRLQRSLKALADAPPATVGTPSASPHRHTPRTVQHSSRRGDGRVLPNGRSGSFAEHVARSMTSPILRYSQRLQLLRDARRFGVNRFEANLVIAAMLERRRADERDVQSRDRSVVSAVTTFLLVQGALLLGAWWTLFR